MAGKVKLQPPVLTASSSISSGSSGVDGPPGARPLLIVKAARHKPGATPQALNAFVYFSLEAASHYSWAAPDAKLSALFDFAGSLPPAITPHKGGFLQGPMWVQSLAPLLVLE